MTESITIMIFLSCLLCNLQKYYGQIDTWEVVENNNEEVSHPHKVAEKVKFKRLMVTERTFCKERTYPFVLFQILRRL